MERCETPEQMASTPPEQRTVTVMYRNHWFGGDGWTNYPVTITLHWVCPQCGGPRGAPYSHRFHEDGEWFTVSCWENDCGHRDMYADVLRESGIVQRMHQQDANQEATSCNG